MSNFFHISQVICSIQSDIRTYVSSWRKLRKSDENRLLCSDWNISSGIICTDRSYGWL
ncbi:hypothetical protein RHGRI_015439 [Rhododendron griersonianum]|uniref:Uncharacterized protein n=1 Tax=Rhododendron griersonianum TaxID=479676 RepID=A0AAV6KD98_9ERIC|nr:hypothetical protein RHGRI_015439 [Rhododendron griersonianum]